MLSHSRAANSNGLSKIRYAIHLVINNAPHKCVYNVMLTPLWGIKIETTPQLHTVNTDNINYTLGHFHNFCY
jgi:hypothetical protein